MENEILKIKDICFEREQFLLKIAEFKIYKNRINFICGYNGSGKTTLIEELSGVHNRKVYLDKFSVGFSDNFVVKQLSCQEMAEFKKGFHKKWDDELFAKILNFAKIDSKRKCTELSSGQAKILNFALAIAPKEEILILDEPFTGVDYSLRDFAYTLLIDYTEQGTVLFSGHEIEEAWRISDIFTIIDNGKMVFHDTKDSIEENYLILKSEEKIDSKEILFANQFEGVRSYLFRKDAKLELVKGSKILPTFNEIYKIILRGE